MNRNGGVTRNEKLEKCTEKSTQKEWKLVTRL